MMSSIHWRINDRVESYHLRGIAHLQDNWGTNTRQIINDGGITGADEPSQLVSQLTFCLAKPGSWKPDPKPEPSLFDYPSWARASWI